MLRFLPIAMLLFFGVLGCNGVKPSDVTGTWVVTEGSRQRLPTAQQKASAKIVLDANGSFVASDLPEDLLYGPEVADRLVTGSGVWKLVSREGGQQVQLEFHAIAVGQRGGVPHGALLDVSRGWSALRLFYFKGDADEGRRIEFERK